MQDLFQKWVSYISGVQAVWLYETRHWNSLQVIPLWPNIYPAGCRKDEGDVEWGWAGEKTRIREMGYVKMSFCEKCADGATMEKEIEIAAKTWWWPIQNLGAADALHVRRRRLRGYGGNFDNYNLATTCPNLRIAKLIRVGAPGARSTNQAEYSGMKQEQGMAAFWP